MTDAAASESTPVTLNPNALTKGNLNDWMYRLLLSEPFYAVISRYIEKRVNLKIPTARVFVGAGGHFILEYNPNFFAGLTDTETLGVLRHEFQHIVLGHLTSRGFDTLPKEDRRFWNIATDLAINSMLGKDSLPKGCLFPGDGEFKDMPELLSAEHYLSLVRKNHEDAEDGQSDHSGWGEPGEEVDGEGNPIPGSGAGDVNDGRREIAEKRIKDILGKAISQCGSSNSWGSVSDQLRKEILERVRTVVDWRKVLRFFVHATQRADKVNSIRRVNKRFPYIHPGRKIVRHANIAISIDMSGSVDDELLATFFSELEKLSHIAQFTVVPFDCEVANDKVFVWKKGQKVKPARVLSGGTDFDAPTRWVNERNFDGHIICTDMCAPKPGPSKCRRMWATTKTDAESQWSHQPEGERVIYVERPKSK